MRGLHVFHGTWDDLGTKGLAVFPNDCPTSHVALRQSNLLLSVNYVPRKTQITFKENGNSRT